MKRRKRPFRHGDERSPFSVHLPTTKRCCQTFTAAEYIGSQITPGMRKKSVLFKQCSRSRKSFSKLNDEVSLNPLLRWLVWRVEVLEPSFWSYLIYCGEWNSSTIERKSSSSAMCAESGDSGDWNQSCSADCWCWLEHRQLLHRRLLWGSSEWVRNIRRTSALPLGSTTG